MFANQGTRLHLANADVPASPAVTTAVTDPAEAPPLTEMPPSISKQPGADSLTSSGGRAATRPAQPVDGKAPLATGDQDDGDVPDRGQT